MENLYGTVRVFEIVLTNRGKTAPNYIDLDNVDLSGDINSEVRERLEDDEGLLVDTFNWEILEPGAEEQEKIDRVKAILRKYFDTNDEGETNPEYDEDYSAQDAIDDIHDIVGSI